MMGDFIKMVFSYFEKSIKNTRPSHSLNLDELAQLVRNNPNAGLIESIRNLRRNGDDYYKKLKKKSSYITPHCVVKERKLSDNDLVENLLSLSQFLYFDIDIPDADYKDNFISKYGHLVSFVCKSISGGGISVFIKVDVPITVKNFDDLWLHIRNSVFKDETIDESANDIGQAMFVSLDEDPYINSNNYVTVGDFDLTKIQKKTSKGLKQPILYWGDSINRLIEPFPNIAINELLNRIQFKSSISIENPILDFKQEKYIEITFPRKILDGTKHKLYTAMIHGLVHLNQSLEPEYLLSYLCFLNKNFATPRMEYKKLVELFNFVYKSIKSDPNYRFSSVRDKWIHFSSSSGLNGDKKRELASKLNGVRRTNNTIEKIQWAKNQLNSKGINVTQRSVAELAGLSLSSVKRHFNSEPQDLDNLVKVINCTRRNTDCTIGQYGSSEGENMSYEMSNPKGH